MGTWGLFGKDICCNNFLLVEKCKSFCNMLDENVSIVEANLWILNKVEKLLNRAKQIVYDNSVVFVGTNATLYIEQRRKFCYDITHHYQGTLDLLVSIRKTFPSTGDGMIAIQNTIEAEGNEDPYIESHPVPNFWP